MCVCVCVCVFLCVCVCVWERGVCVLEVLERRRCRRVKSCGAVESQHEHCHLFRHICECTSSFQIIKKH